MKQTRADESTAFEFASERLTPVLGVVLAGGKSSRMGCDKASLVHVNGQTYLQHAISRLLLITSHVAISGRTVDDGKLLSIPDLIADQGPAVAIWSAVSFAKQLGFGSILVTPIDTPFLKAEQLRQFLVVSEGQPVCAEIPSGVAHPLIGFYPVQYEEKLQAVAAAPRRSLRLWFEQYPYPRIKLDEQTLADVNTKDDFVNSQIQNIREQESTDLSYGTSEADIFPATPQNGTGVSKLPYKGAQ